MTTPAIPSSAAQCRAYIAELAGVIAANAEIVERYAELGDDVGLRYQLQRLVLHVRAATATFKDLAEIENACRAENKDISDAIMPSSRSPLSTVGGAVRKSASFLRNHTTTMSVKQGQNRRNLEKRG